MEFLVPITGIVMLAYCVYSLMESKQLYTEGVRAEGQIVGLNEKRGTRDKETGYREVTFAPVIRFTDDNGRDVVFTSSQRSRSSRFLIGNSIDIIYNRDNPKKAVIDGIMSLWMMPAISGLMGALCFVTGMAM